VLRNLSEISDGAGRQQRQMADTLANPSLVIDFRAWLTPSRGLKSPQATSTRISMTSCSRIRSIMSSCDSAGHPL
jgi:hypothetical protein